MAWFEEAKIPRPAAVSYSKSFAHHSISFEHLPSLDHSLLTEMGIKSVGHRLNVLKQARSLFSPFPFCLSSQFVLQVLLQNLS